MLSTLQTQLEKKLERYKKKKNLSNFNFLIMFSIYILRTFWEDQLLLMFPIALHIFWWIIFAFQNHQQNIRKENFALNSLHTTDLAKKWWGKEQILSMLTVTKKFYKDVVQPNYDVSQKHGVVFLVERFYISLDLLSYKVCLLFWLRWKFETMLFIFLFF